MRTGRLLLSKGPIPGTSTIETFVQILKRPGLFNTGIRRRQKRSAQVGEPIRIRRIARHVPVVVGLSVFPPNRTSLAQGPLRRIDGCVRSVFSRAVLHALGPCNGAPGFHKPFDERVALIGIEPRIAHPPETSANDEVTSIGSDGMLCADPGLGNSSALFCQRVMLLVGQAP